MTNKWEISDQTNDQNSLINDQMTVLVANFWSLIMRQKMWSHLVWSFIYCLVVINFVIFLALIWLNIWSLIMTINDHINEKIYDQINEHKKIYK